ncbi:hypothetical protein [Paenibacillus methanolicus]|uniref:Uncharacterized protein n=1 Tax=Paenibacillus methanolicus TaxID=582686 RepID=A0A5S5C3H4_9BACL|nr:hypothetical protein [Paenibacillus methanolicus]TYP73168.1 hypothetical protein BCM02_107152 [Paenibacillus methanolicus]
MNEHLFGEIVPWERMGIFLLGEHIDAIKRKIDFAYTVVVSGDCTIVESEGIDLFFDENLALIQLTAYGTYKGKVLGEVGVGSILADYRDLLEYELIEDDNDCNFFSKQYKGIYFILEGWDDDNSAIKSISVNKIPFNSEA